MTVPQPRPRAAMPRGVLGTEPFPFGAPPAPAGDSRGSEAAGLTAEERQFRCGAALAVGLVARLCRQQPHVDPVRFLEEVQRGLYDQARDPAGLRGLLDGVIRSALQRVGGHVL